jgi:phage gpG-like protein
MNIEFQIEGEVQLNRRLRVLSTSLDDFSGAFSKIGGYLGSFFKNEVFDTEGGVFGERWAIGQYYHKLQRTGKMKNSFIHKEAKDYVLITNTAPYFKYHQSKLPRRKLPRRIMMKIDESRRQRIIKYFQEAIITKANQAA